MTALLHDAIVAVFILWGVIALCTVLRQDFDRIAKGQRRRQIWGKK